MKFTRLFLIKLSPDEIIDDSAELYRDWYQVPQERRWSNVGDANWGELSDGCIGRDGEKPTLQDKLMVIAHGSKTCVGEGDKTRKFDAIDLVQALKLWGIDDIGLISFKCCHVGAGTFLDTFVTAANRYSLNVGWLKGYTAATRTLRKLPIVGKPYELVSTPDTILGSSTLFGFDIYSPIFGDDRIRIHPGNKPFPVPNSRYLLDSDDR